MSPGSLDPEIALRGEGWVPDEEGTWHRRGARVIVVDDDDRLLLLHGFSTDDSERHWWFTVGGGVLPGEDDRTAAARELAEETGFVVPVDELVGPVATHAAEFPMFGRPCRQDEVLFVAQVPSGMAMTDEGWAAIERATIDAMQWWDLEALLTSPTLVYPRGLAGYVQRLVANGWDGIVWDFGNSAGEGT